MRMELCHQGNVRQHVLAGEDGPSSVSKLHVPLIELPKDTQEVNLHGDIDGSPYSKNPGRIGLAEAAAEAEEAAAARWAPRRSERGGEDPKPSSSSSAGKK